MSAKECEFKIGDQVKCLDPTGRLQKDAIYTVKRIYDNKGTKCLEFNELKFVKFHNYKASRFMLAEDYDANFKSVIRDNVRMLEI